MTKAAYVGCLRTSCGRPEFERTSMGKRKNGNPSRRRHRAITLKVRRRDKVRVSKTKKHAGDKSVHNRNQNGGCHSTRQFRPTHLTEIACAVKE